MLTLRPYQQLAVDAVYQHLREHDTNPVVVIPTGGGKTPVMATICRDAVQQWNGRVLVLAHVKELLQQSVDKLRQVCLDLPVGVYSAGLKRRDTEHAVIVAGIQSVYKRACEHPSSPARRHQVRSKSQELTVPPRLLQRLVRHASTCQPPSAA